MKTQKKTKKAVYTQLNTIFFASKHIITLQKVMHIFMVLKSYIKGDQMTKKTNVTKKTSSKPVANLKAEISDISNSIDTNTEFKKTNTKYKNVLKMNEGIYPYKAGEGQLGKHRAKSKRVDVELGKYSLTEKQKKVLIFVSHHITSVGFPPTVRQVAVYFGVSAIGNTIKVYVNDVEVASATDATYTQGFCGIWSASATIDVADMTFDNNLKSGMTLRS